MNKLLDISFLLILFPLFLFSWVTIGVLTKIINIVNQSELKERFVYLIAGLDRIENKNHWYVSKMRMQGFNQRPQYIVHLSDIRESVIRDEKIIRIPFYIPKVIWNMKLQFAKMLIILILLRIKLFFLLSRLAPKYVFSFRSVYAGIVLASLKNSIGYKLVFGNIDGVFMWSSHKEEKSHSRFIIPALLLGYIQDGYVFRRADLILSIGLGTMDYQIMLGAPPSRIIRTHMAVDLSHYKEGNKVYNIDPEILESLDNRKFFLFIGRFISQRYALHTIEAFIEFSGSNKQDENICLCIVGDGPKKKQIENAIESSIYKDRIIYMGYLDQNTLSYLYKNTVGLIALFSGGVLIEAGLNESPVIVYPVDLQMDKVTHGESGLVADMFDIVSIAKNMHIICDNKSLAKKMGKSLKTKILKIHSPDYIQNRSDYIFHRLENTKVKKCSLLF
jgi:glycosyltransferase involved in cell wall biosynthesis